MRLSNRHNKKLSQSFEYNYLNLPKYAAGEITYDANGTKWKKVSGGITHQYINGIEYKNSELYQVHAPDGRLVADKDPIITHLD